MTGDVGERYSRTVHGLLLKRIWSARRARPIPLVSGSNNRATSGSIARRTETLIKPFNCRMPSCKHKKYMYKPRDIRRTHEKLFVSTARASDHR